MPEHKVPPHYPHHKAHRIPEAERVKSALRFAKTDEERTELEREMKIRGIEDSSARIEQAVPRHLKNEEGGSC